MHRRTALLVIGAAAVGGYIAEQQVGLLQTSQGDEETISKDGSDNNDDDGGNEGSADGDAADEPGATTATPVSDGSGGQGPTHGIGETFELRNVEYEVTGVYQADELGSATNQVTADGVFLVTVVSVTNNSETTLDFPGTIFRLRSGESWRYLNERASDAAAADDRINLNSWVGGSVATGASRTRVAAFDVDPSKAFDLMFLPPEGAEAQSHFVALGEAGGMDYLRGAVSG